MGKIQQRIKKDFEYEKEVVQDYPKNMLVELTNYCNHKCIFCENRKMTRKKGFINKDLLRGILEEAYSLGTREVGYYATGEPLMCKDLPAYIKMAKDIGFEYVYITTNGALMTKEKIKEIVESGIDSIKFSINAGKIKTYKIIHGSDDFERVIDNLRNLYEFKNKNKLDFKIYVSYVRTKQNKDEVDLLKRKISKYIDDIIIFDAENQGGNMYEINGLLTLDDSHGSIKAPCPMVFNRFHITYEGYLNICCVDFQNYLVVADLNIMPLKEAWNCENVKDIRKKHLENNLKGIACYNCINNSNIKIDPLLKKFATISENNLDKNIKVVKERLGMI